jgi:myo-inositol catabolism protein IolC
MKNETEILNKLRNELKLDVERWDGCRDERMKKIIKKSMMAEYEAILSSDRIKKILNSKIEPEVWLIKKIHKEETWRKIYKQIFSGSNPLFP